MILRGGTLTSATWDAIAERSPANPFCTAAYIAARSTLGSTPHLLEAGGIQAVGFERIGWGWRSLDLPSMPIAADDDPFWRELERLARDRGVTRLELNSFGALGARLPASFAAARRWLRAEQVLDLDGQDLLSGCDRTHRQRIRQAERAGCVLEWSTDPDAVPAHAALLEASIERRRGEGEAPDLPIASYRALLSSDAGRVAAVRVGEASVASCLVLLAREGAYLQSSGSSAQGKGIGAHHFMVFRVATDLMRDGRRQFNLGGTRDAEPGLRGFKERFGSRLVECEAGVLPLGGMVSALRARVAFVGRRFRLAGP